MMENKQMKNLLGKWVSLEALTKSHYDELYTIAQDERIWTYNANKAYGDKFNDWFAKALTSQKQQQHMPFVVRRLADRQLVGSTRFYDISPEHARLTIGYTWYIPAVWGTEVNPESKYLLLQYALETLRMNRVEFTTDKRNLRSRAAIKKLGAVEEGILRQHMILEDGTIRDSVIFSIIQPEWPQIKKQLQQRLLS